MELKKGYKQTEIGIIPEDWEVKTFIDFADKNDKWCVVGGPFGSNLKSDCYTSEGIRIVQLQNIGDGVFIDKYKIYTSELKANELISCNIYPNEIIISKMGDPVARACFIPNIDKRYLMASDGIRLAVNEREYDKRFVLLFINSTYFRKQAFESSIGSTRLRISLPVLKRLPILKPKKEEQTAIANALTDIDDLISALEEKIEKKKNIKQGAMQELLKPKEGWVEKRLGDLMKVNTGSKNTQDKVENGVYPFFIRSDKVERINTYSYDCEAVLTAGDGDIGKIFHYINGKFEVHQRVYIMNHFDEDLNALYFYYYFKNNFYNRVMQMTAKSSVDSIRKDMITEMIIPIPPTIEEQERIATILFDMDKEIEGLVGELEKYRMIKEGMMKDLLTGRIRLI